METDFAPVVGVYRAIAAVAADIARTGVAKDRRNVQQGYAFRGIDDLYNALAPLLAQHSLCILPTVEERQVVERKTARDTPLFFTTVRVRFAFVSALDGSTHYVVTYGEAMDSADKSTNKAMSAAYKYAVLQAFCIPTEADNDADTTTHRVVSNVLSPTDAVTVFPGAEVVEPDDGREALEMELRALVEAAGYTIAAVCQKYAVEALSDLSDEQLKEALERARKARKRR